MTTSSSVGGGTSQVDKAPGLSPNSEAPTQSSTQNAASHLSRWAPLTLVSAGFFWCWERLPGRSAPMFEVRVAFFWGERSPCWRSML
eukprot:scaffold5376_cov48-Phaeocystis_antarctica.AAC.3